VTAAILKVLDVTMGLRVSDDEEVMGLDVSQHGERAYVMEEGGIPLQGVPASEPQPARTSQSPPTARPMPSPGGNS